jgi:hypothetical protein
MRLYSAVFALLLSLSHQVCGHAIPDIPVRGWFSSDGTAIIRVEVDPRAFEADPENEPYLLKAVFETIDAKEREQMIKLADEFIRKHVEFYFQPLQVTPKFEFSFIGHNTNQLVKADDPVMISAEWKTKIPKGIEGYQIKAIEVGDLATEFLNFIDGKALERVNVLFPGETSFLLDLTKLSASAPVAPAKGSVGFEATPGDRWATLWDFLKQGFVHVVPKGLDHILFVLGLFLLSRKWKPVLLQVTMFTLAHTITLALATLGLVSVSSAVVEPIIAGSIAYVAIENIYRREYSHWRLVVVFAFGLIHGLGFAGALGDLALPASSMVVGLLGFNIGVEFGQLAVIAAAFGVTFWLKDETQYRNRIVIPGSATIAVCGIYWMIERVAKG